MNTRATWNPPVGWWDELVRLAGVAAAAENGRSAAAYEALRAHVAGAGSDRAEALATKDALLAIWSDALAGKPWPQEFEGRTVRPLYEKTAALASTAGAQTGALHKTRAALVELRDRCAKVKDKLNAGITEGEPVHDCASDLTWPMSTAGLAISAIDAALSAPAQSQALTQAACDVLAERERQVKVEGWTPEHDDQHDDGSMALAAACYTMFASVSDEARQATDLPSELTTTGHSIHGWSAWLEIWPWARSWWKPKDRRSDLTRAGALILAEIERLDRAAAAAKPEGQR